MIKIENVEVVGWEHAIRGMRNPKNSWDRSDSEFKLTVMEDYPDIFKHEVYLGPNDLDLANRLANGGPVHAKYRRMIVVYMDITCHHTWWAEFDTYKVGTVRNSCSKMHKIHVKEFVKDDFSHEGIDQVGNYAADTFENVVKTLERLRVDFNRTGEEKYWRAIIEILPIGFNIKATVMLDYEVLANMYKWRKTHKVFEWIEFCELIESLPYSELITGKCEVKEVEKKEETDDLTCEGCKWDDSINVIEYLGHCVHCKRAYSKKVYQDIHEDKYEAKEEEG